MSNVLLYNYWIVLLFLVGQASSLFSDKLGHTCKKSLSVLVITSFSWITDCSLSQTKLNGFIFWKISKTSLFLFPDQIKLEKINFKFFPPNLKLVSIFLFSHNRYCLQRAIEEGADFIETDILSSKDGVLICFHDVTLDETTDIAKHNEFTNRKRTYDVQGVNTTGFFTGTQSFLIFLADGFVLLNIVIILEQKAQQNLNAIFLHLYQHYLWPGKNKSESYFHYVQLILPLKNLRHYGWSRDIHSEINSIMVSFSSN